MNISVHGVLVWAFAASLGWRHFLVFYATSKMHFTSPSLCIYNDMYITILFSLGINLGFNR